MPLGNEEIISLIEKGASPRMKLARKEAKKINMHVTGLGVKDYLEKLDDYETNAQKILREKLVRSNRSLFSFILRPTDKIFTAKGGSINYHLPQEKVNEMKDRISDVADGFDIKKYLKKVVKSQYIIDPNGVLFIDIDDKGMLETNIVNSKEILWYKNKGNKVHGIIFEPYKKQFSKSEETIFESLGILKSEKDKKYYRVIDEEFDRIYINDGGVIKEDITQRISNYFGFVPALILGDEKDANHNIFESVIKDIIEDADMFLRRVSVSNVHELAHLYPRYWSYEQACTRCGGEGTIDVVTDDTTVPPTTTSETCTSCGGSGSKTRTNPDDEIILRTPQDGEPVLAPNVAGFVQPDIQSSKFYNELIEQARNTMFQAMWGTTYEQGGKRETATGRFLDAQPVQDRLRDISDTFAKMHKFLLDCYGKVLLRKPRYESSVSYGTRYILESPDDILDKYVEVSRETVSEISKLDMRNRYFEAEYQNDTLGLVTRMKLAQIEPFPTMLPSDVADIEGLDSKDVLAKLYYSSWVGTLTEAEKVFWSTDELRVSLNKYVNTKSLTKNEAEEI